MVQFTQKKAGSPAVAQTTLTYRPISVAAMLTYSLEIDHVLLNSWSVFYVAFQTEQYHMHEGIKVM